jgi:hypothetical protein
MMKALTTEIHKRIRDWLDDNQEQLPRLKSGKRWLIGYGWDQNILPGGRYPTAVLKQWILSNEG